METEDPHSPLLFSERGEVLEVVRQLSWRYPSYTLTYHISRVEPGPSGSRIVGVGAKVQCVQKVSRPDRDRRPNRPRRANE